jgi:hydrogenase/urease accessory protein HupE
MTQPNQRLRQTEHQHQPLNAPARLWKLPSPWPLLLLLAFGVWTTTVSAHPIPLSYLDIQLDANGAHGALVVHDYDAAHELGLEKPESLLDPAVGRDYGELLTRILAPRLQITVDARREALQWQTPEVLADSQNLRLPFKLESHSLGKIDVAAVLFPYDANHQSFVNIYENGALKHQAILNAQHHALTYYSGNLQGRWTVVRTFVQAGIHHILIGPDHILFLLGLLLLGGSLQRLAAIVTAFTVGHSITLSLAALDLVTVAPRLVEPAIALSIVVVGVDNLLMRKRGATQGRDLRPWLAAAFGLIHGFGFAAVLLEFGLPRAALGWSLAAFNIGVEIGQLMIVVVTASLLALLRQYSTVYAQRCAWAGSVAVIAAGVFWFAQRILLSSAA